MFKYSIWIHLFIEELYFQTSCCVSLPPERHIQHLRNHRMYNKYSFSHNFPQACKCCLPKPTPTPTPPRQAKKFMKMCVVWLGRQSQHRETGRHSVRLSCVTSVLREFGEEATWAKSREGSGKWYPGLPRRVGASRSLHSVSVWPKSKRSGRTGEVGRLWVGIVGPYVLSHSVISDSLRPHGLQPTRLLCPWDSPGKRPRVGYHFLLQGTSQPKELTHVSCISSIANGFFTTEPPGKPGTALTSIKIESSWSSMFAYLLIFKQMQAWRNHHKILENSLVHISDLYKNISEVCPTLELSLLELNKMLTIEWWAGKKKFQNNSINRKYRFQLGRETKTKENWLFWWL